MSKFQTLKKRRALQRTRAQTQRLKQLQRRAARSEKEAERELEPGQLSRKERIFRSGLDAYREHYQVKKIKKIIDAAHKKLQKAKKNTFYIRVNGRPIQLEDIGRYRSFDLLYLDKSPDKSYYVEFEEDEEERDNNYYYMFYYFTRVYVKPPFHFFLDWDKLRDIPYDIRVSILGPDSYYFVGEFNTPMGYLLQFPDFMEKYEEALDTKEARKVIARQKLEALQLRGLDRMLEEQTKKTGTVVPENLQYHIRTMMTRHPVHREYNPTLQNFAGIQTNLFE